MLDWSIIIPLSTGVISALVMLGKFLFSAGQTIATIKKDIQHIMENQTNIINDIKTLESHVFQNKG